MIFVHLFDFTRCRTNENLRRVHVNNIGNEIVNSEIELCIYTFMDMDLAENIYTKLDIGNVLASFALYVLSLF